MRKVLPTLFAVVAIVVCWPVLQHSLRAVRIVLQPAPVVLAIPVEGVAAGALRDSWHAPRSGGRRHQGIDIFAPRHTPVRSSTAGIVWKVGQNRLGGNVIWIMGPGAEMHYYAHLEGFADVHFGKILAEGDQLGTVGDSGNARGAPTHLHYGIYTGGGAVNPFPRLKPSDSAADSGASSKPDADAVK